MDWYSERSFQEKKKKEALRCKFRVFRNFEERYKKMLQDFHSSDEQNELTKLIWRAIE